MATIRMCVVQMQVGASSKENLPKILEYIAKNDCDFIVFPEMSLTGFKEDFSDARTAEAWRQIAAACRQHYVNAIIGTGARAENHTFIQSRIYADDGELLGTHEKLVPTADDRKHFWPGSELRTFRRKGISFGCLIGNDFWVAPGQGPYPDMRLSHQLGERGAQVIFLSAHTGSDPHYAEYHEVNLKLRAMESKCYIVSANAANGDAPLNAPSGVLSPEGEWLVRCPPTGEHCYTHDLELDIE